MGAKVEIHLGLHPGLIEIHQLQRCKSKTPLPCALVHARQFAQTHFRGHHDISMVIMDEAEERQRAPPIKPRRARLGIRPDAACSEPSPKAWPVAQWNLIGIVVGSEPRRAVAEGIHDLDNRAWLDFQ